MMFFMYCRRVFVNSLRFIDPMYIDFNWFRKFTIYWQDMLRSSGSVQCATKSQSKVAANEMKMKRTVSLKKVFKMENLHKRGVRMEN